MSPIPAYSPITGDAVLRFEHNGGRGMLKRIGFRGLVVGLIAGLAVGGTFAWAAIPGGVNGQISACYPTSGANKGVLRVIDYQTGERCAAGETLLNWQQKGLRFLGTYSATTVYSVNDLVTSGGRAFVRIAVTQFFPTGIATSNTTYWAPLSAPLASAACGGYPHAGIDWSKSGSTPGNGCDFHGANFTSANLSGANLTDANLAAANFTTATLSAANLSGANLSVASFFHGSLVSANLNGASLTNAYLAAADVTGADMTNADLTGANFGFATGTDSIVYSNTTCPDGSNSDANGGTCAGFGGGL